MARHNGATWLWTEGLGFEYLGQGMATDMTADGSIVVGFRSKPGAVYEYDNFRWSRDAGTVLLPFEGPYVPGISRDGSVVFGATGESSSPMAIVWDEESGVRDFREVLTATFGLGSQLEGWQLTYVVDTSGDGRTIIGSGINPNGDEEPWMAVLDPLLQAGDADQDGDFDQLDLVKVQVAGEYLTGQPATWGEGDWNGILPVFSTKPPQGDGVFNQLDIVAALPGGPLSDWPLPRLSRRR